MQFLDDIIRALSDLVVVLPKTNRENRKEIREVVLSVQSEMERAIELAIIYMNGVKRIKGKDELVEYLENATMKLLDSYNEFKICAGLYGLADRFDEAFSSVKGSISVAEIKSVEDLIRGLSSGERLVIDGLRNFTGTMSEAGSELAGLSGQAYDDKRQAVLDRIDLEVTSMRAQLGVFRTSVREILKKM